MFNPSEPWLSTNEKPQTNNNKKDKDKDKTKNSIPP